MGLREASNNRRASNLSTQMTFDQFMTNQKPTNSNFSSMRGRASVGAMRSPIRGSGLSGAPLVKPD